MAFDSIQRHFIEYPASLWVLREIFLTLASSIFFTTISRAVLFIRKSLQIGSMSGVSCLKGESSVFFLEAINWINGEDNRERKTGHRVDTNVSVGRS